MFNTGVDTDNRVTWYARWLSSMAPTPTPIRAQVGQRDIRCSTPCLASRVVNLSKLCRS